MSIVQDADGNSKYFASTNDKWNHMLTKLPDDPVDKYLPSCSKHADDEQIIKELAMIVDKKHHMKKVAASKRVSDC